MAQFQCDTLLRPSHIVHFCAVYPKWRLWKIAPWEYPTVYSFTLLLMSVWVVANVLLLLTVWPLNNLVSQFFRTVAPICTLTGNAWDSLRVYPMQCLEWPDLRFFFFFQANRHKKICLLLWLWFVFPWSLTILNINSYIFFFFFLALFPLLWIIFFMPTFSIALAVFCLLNFGFFFPLKVLLLIQIKELMFAFYQWRNWVRETQDHITIHSWPVWHGVYWGFQASSVFLLLSLWMWNVRSGSGPCYIPPVG